MKKAFSITEDYDNICWEEVFPKLLPVLMAYAYSLIGSSRLRLIKNKDDLAYDFAMDTINHYLENPEGFDSTRNKDLVKYLKFNILRRLVSNFKSLKGQQNEYIYENDDSIGKSVSKMFMEGLDIHDEVDYTSFIENIFEELKDKPLLLEVFELRVIKDSVRREICKDLNISKEEYNNRFRRLRTIIKKVRILSGKVSNGK